MVLSFSTRGSARGGRTRGKRTKGGRSTLSRERVLPREFNEEEVVGPVRSSRGVAVVISKDKRIEDVSP